MAEAIVADKGCNSERIQEQIESNVSRAVIPRKRNSVKGSGDLDRGLYRYRHLVENAFTRLNIIEQCLAIRKAEKELRKYGRHGVRCPMATDVKRQQTLIGKR